MSRSDIVFPPLDGDVAFPGGMNSSVDPTMLQPGTYCRAWNTINRRGVVSTRPGFRWRADLPAGRRQGFTVFLPLIGMPQLVAVIAGYVHVSSYPYNSFVQLPNIKFDPYKETVFFALTEQAVTLNSDNSNSFVNPRRVLFMQDGDAPPAYYDGSKNGHITGLDKTPQGGPMIWTGSRLWVANRNRILASNILDPFNFTEQYYLGGSDAFYLEDNVTAMTETSALTGSSQMIAFTARSASAFATSNRNRDLWANTANFQSKIFPDVGCVSSRSVREQFGILWWMSGRGLTNLNYAAQTFVSSSMRSADNEMADDKARVDSALNKVVIGSFENFLLVSVPFGGNDNVHTWVLDNSVLSTLVQTTNPVWSSIWTGFNVSDWAAVNVEGADRIYGLMSDAEGNNSVWEGFQGRTDNGQDIEAALELRGYSGGTSQLKRNRFLEASFVDVAHDVNVAMYWRGTNRGRYKRSQLRTFSTGGCPVVSMGMTVTPTTLLAEGGVQSRVLRTQELENAAETDPLSSDGIEEPRSEQLDFSFQHLIRWSGQAGVRQARFFTEAQEPESNTGDAFSAPEVTSYARRNGSTSRNPEVLSESSSGTYSADAAYTGTARGMTRTAAGHAVSAVSPEAALKQAKQAAAAQVDHELAELAPKVYGGIS